MKFVSTCCGERPNFIYINHILTIMKKFTLLVLSTLTLAWLTLQAIELEPEERDEIEEAGIELSEQLDEAQQNKEELSEELKHLNAEGELWEASNLELELHNVELRVELLEKLVSRHRDCLLYTSPSPQDVEEPRMPSSA